MRLVGQNDHLDELQCYRQIRAQKKEEEEATKVGADLNGGSIILSLGNYVLLLEERSLLRPP